ncbi:TetR family transcriptional regulator [Deinococcus marmoris]|uniref:Transcriptional regulator, TetR family n=1 Tax=Deinococcus marmoris TaxID=249408 RepID=A0A1U7NTA5_9DEIO|nr:TetR family transcriptional regulator [Deinococcus marmoris]OLV16154.1 Transcriptional regulator, TetR family [Deinococcus marmoris]
MKRDAQATKQRIFEAATAEFAQYGIAGARIDRIAAAAGSNKAMIYTYFGSKDELFDAVGVEQISRHMNDVPMDAHDLPDYAAKVVEHYRQHPEIMRLVTWARLERGPEAGKLTGLLDSYGRKVEAVAQAQRSGVISDRFPAATLLELILALIQTNAGLSAAPDDGKEFQRRQQAIQAAVARLVQP